MAVHLTRGLDAESPQRFYRFPHIAYLNAKVQQAIARAEATGVGGRLIVSMPPGLGKSTYCGVWLPTWYLGHFPDRAVICAANTMELARRNGRWVRDQVDEHGAAIGISLRADQQAAAVWATTDGGGLFACGVGARLPGWRAHLILVDDPHGGLKEVYSPVQRAATWDWWTGTLRNRLNTGGTIVVLCTRWHEDDLPGRLIAQAKDDPEADQWEVVSIPAAAEMPEGFGGVSWTEAAPDEELPEDWERLPDGRLRDPIGRTEPGQNICRDLFTDEELRTLEASSEPYVWGALFQQRPKPREGNMFSRSTLLEHLVDAVPDGADLVRYWDRAATKHEGANEKPQTAGALGCMVDGVFYLADMVTFQDDPAGNEQRIRDTAKADGPGVRIHIEQEPGSAGVDVIAHYQRHVLPGYYVEGDRPSAAKEVRAIPLSGAARTGRLKLVRGPWVRAFVEEANGFPNAKRKDQVDAASALYALLTDDGDFI